jgi:hypothetical protein
MNHLHILYDGNRCRPNRMKESEHPTSHVIAELERLTSGENPVASIP